MLNAALTLYQQFLLAREGVAVHVVCLLCTCTFCAENQAFQVTSSNMTDRKKLLKDSVDQISPNQTPKREYSSTISSHEPQTPIRKNRISGWPLKSVTPRYRKRIEVLCLVLAVVVVLGLFAIPIAFHIKQVRYYNYMYYNYVNYIIVA